MQHDAHAFIFMSTIYFFYRRIYVGLVAQHAKQSWRANCKQLFFLHTMHAGSNMKNIAVHNVHSTWKRCVFRMYEMWREIIRRE